MIKHTEVIVIGGGVIGASIVYELTKSGRKAVLLEKGSFAGGSTGKSGAFLRVYHEDPVLSDLAAESFPSYLNFQEEIGAPCGYVRTGLLYYEPYERYERMSLEVERLNQLGCRIELVSKSRDEGRFPTIHWESSDTAVYEPDGGYADPLLTTHAWINRARDLGAIACEGIEVKEMVMEKGKIAGVVTTGGVVRSPIVIVAAGAWSAALASKVGVQLQVRSRAIQIQYYQRPEFYAHPAFIDGVTGLYGRPEREQLSLIGYPVEEWDVNPDRDCPIDEVHAERARLVAAPKFDWVRSSVLSGGRRSFDGYTPNQRGILKYDDHIEGLIYAAGWSGGGFKLAPAIGRRVRNMVDLIITK